MVLADNHRARNRKDQAMTAKQTPTPADPVISSIAKDLLGLATLQTRNADSLDFHDLAVWQIRKALEAAYQAGRTVVGGATSVSFATAREALAHARQGRLVAIRLEGINQVVSQAEADRLEAAGIAFGYLGEVNGRVVVVPRS